MNGILIGTGFDRAFVAMPAWRRVGPLGWAAFSRHADLGNGLIFYPLEAFGGMIFSVAAAVLLFRNPTGPRSARMPLCAAAGFAIGGLLFTVMAAPIMLSLRRLGDDPATLQEALERFEFWGNLRFLSQALAFIANLWSLVAISSDLKHR